MVPNVTAGGASFMGATAYYLHDKEAATSMRVAWTETVNLITHDPAKATRVMAATAMAQHELKAEAGIKATGRKLAKPVYVYSLSWHPEEQPAKATMVEAAKESLKALGAEDRQALIVCHNDEPHPHVHVIVNRVSMEDGRAANMRGDRLKLSRWAESWERRHGKVYCEQRVGNNERRDQGEFVRGTSNVPRAVFEAIRDGLKGFNDNRDARQAAAELKVAQQRKAAELVAQGREMHRSNRQELADLAADYRRDKAKIIEANRAEFKALQAETRTSIRQAMQKIWAQQRREGQTEAWRERSMLGRAWNAFNAGRSADSAGARIGRIFWASLSTSARLDALRQQHERQRQAVYAELTAETRRQQAELRATVVRRLDANYHQYVVARASTLRQYRAEKCDYAGKWAEHTQARRGTWRQFREKYEPRESDRRRSEEREASRQRRYEQQRENLRRTNERFNRVERQHGRARSKGPDEGLER